MQCFRLTLKPHADLSGTGGLREAGRWHARLAPIIYTLSSRALALLEVLVHLELAIDQLPDDYVYQVIDIPDNVEKLSWHGQRAAKGNARATADFGTRWLEEQRSMALITPSVIMPPEPNIMLNPRHPAIGNASFSLEADVAWGQRLFDV